MPHSTTTATAPTAGEPSQQFMQNPSGGGAVPVDEAYRNVSQFADTIAVFFRKRAELEAAHLADLEKLLQKQEDADRRVLDLAFKNSSVHHAWSQIKGILYAELAERRQAVYKLTHSVVDPLVAFKDQKERQRKRIKEETQSTTTEHNEYKAHTLRLKRAYQRKSEEVRTLLQTSEANANTGSPTGSNSSGGAPASGYMSPTQSGSHLGVEAAGRSRSGSRPTSRSGPESNAFDASSSRTSAGKSDVLISGATSTILKDAHSPPQRDSAALFAIKNSRSQLNSLIQKLSSSSSRLSSEGNLKPSSHQLQPRLSKAKREAEECDANYRSALHHLETLRLQRERVHRASLGTLSEYTYEFSNICKSIFAQYCDAWASKAHRLSKSCEIAKDATFAISPADDVTSFSQAVKIDVFMEEPLPYENYHVGVSYSLIFGVSLNEYSASNDGVLIPLTVQRAILEIESRGIETEGIYRVPGKLGLIQQVVQQIEQDEITFEFSPEQHDIHTVAGVLKLYLRQLPEALIPISFNEREQISSSSPAPDEVEDPTQTEAYRLLEKRLRKMPPAHQATAKMLIAHFERVLARQEKNKMGIQALTLCLTPVIFPEETNLAALISGPKHDRCLEYLIAYRQELFSGLPVSEMTRARSRISGGSAEFAGSRAQPEDEDEDPPFRRTSHEYVRSRGPTPKTSNQSLASQPAGKATGKGQPDPNANPMGPLAAPSMTQSAEAREAPPLLLESGTSAGTSSVAAGPLSPPLSWDGEAPRRQMSLSQRARSGSQSLANAMKKLSRQPSNASQSSFSTNPLSPPLLPPVMPIFPPRAEPGATLIGSNAKDDTAEQATPTQAKPPPFPPRPQPQSIAAALSSPPLPFQQSIPAGYSIPLPAGAAPPLQRPPSFSDSTTASSSPSTPGIGGQPSSSLAIPLKEAPIPAMQSASIDPDDIYENYHRSENSADQV